MTYSRRLFVGLVVVAVLASALSRQLHAQELKQELEAAFGHLKQPQPQEAASSTAPDQDSQVSASEGTMIMRYYMPAESHLRAKEGLPFPSESEVVFDPDPPGWQRAIDEGKKHAKITIPSKPYQRPGKCEQNKTKRELLYPDSHDKESAVVYDVLYYPEELITEESVEVFGANAKLWPYGHSSDPSVYTRMKTHNVPCVPYRFRMTNVASYQDSGLNALRNYDKDPAGSGVLSPWVQRQLFGKKQSPKARPHRR